MMLNYELSQVIHVLLPYLGTTLSVIAGIIISNIFWKARIYRFASATLLKTMEYQVNKIEHLEAELKQKKSIISELRGIIKVSKTAALKIIGVIQ